MLSNSQFNYIKSIHKSFLDFEESNKDISNECEDSLRAWMKLKDKSGLYILSLDDIESEEGYIRRTFKKLRGFKSVSSTCVKKLTNMDVSKEEEQWLVLFINGELENFYTNLLEEIDIYREILLEDSDETIKKIRVPLE